MSWILSIRQARRRERPKRFASSFTSHRGDFERVPSTVAPDPAEEAERPPGLSDTSDGPLLAPLSGDAEAGRVPCRGKRPCWDSYSYGSIVDGFVRRQPLARVKAARAVIATTPSVIETLACSSRPVARRARPAFTGVFPGREFNTDRGRRRGGRYSTVPVRARSTGERSSLAPVSCLACRSRQSEPSAGAGTSARTSASP